MTTVAQQDGPTLGQAILEWASGREQLVPRDMVYPPGKSREEVNKENTADFQMSEADAEIAALGYLDRVGVGHYPKAVRVVGVNDPGPSRGKLQAGDAIEKFDGTPITSDDQFQSLLRKTKPEQNVVIEYKRKSSKPDSPTITDHTTITLGSSPDRDWGFLGIARPKYGAWAPFEITFNLANIGGPSAGLMFALAVVDKLTTGDLVGNTFVAGTGTINENGTVGAIGGITHKMVAAHEAGATVFLVPAGNCTDALTGDDGMRLVKVDTLAEAVDALHTLSAGGEPPHC
jgi:PDZ domain-containing protein